MEWANLEVSSSFKPLLMVELLGLKLNENCTLSCNDMLRVTRASNDLNDDDKNNKKNKIMKRKRG